MLLSKQGEASKRSLILAGGGMRVAYQAGVLLALEEGGLSFSHVDGTSGGTMNTSMLFSGNSPRQMCERWQSLNLMDFSSLMPMSSYKNPLKLKAMADADGIVNKVFPHLGIDVEKIRNNNLADASFNLCNFSTKQAVSISNAQVQLAHLVAGISLPIFMPSVKIEADDYTDAVWIKDANLWGAVKRGAEELWLVWCIGNTHDYKDGSFNQYVHMIEIAANGGLLEEYDRIEELNQRILKGDSPFGQTKPITLHVIKPEFPLPLDPDFFIGRIDAHELIAMGYRNTTDYLQNKDSQGVSFDWQACAMKEPGANLVCRHRIQIISQNQALSIHLRLRMNLSQMQNNSLSQSQLSIPVFAQVTIADRVVNQPCAEGKLLLSHGKPGRIELAMLVDKAAYKITIEYSKKSWISRLFFKFALCKMQIIKNSEIFDEDQFNLGLIDYLKLKFQMQAGGMDGFFACRSLKNKFLKRLIN
ncbi:MAG: patatin-like phospholipase family protein [Gammaproteobacteria bacterium]|nr:patatin-like phospholipase family protein [Gammaproteobacteria bacterium]